MKPSNGRWLPGFSLVFLVAGGIVLLALLVLAPDYAQARLDGSQPVPLQSGLQANYSMDPMDLVIQPVDMKVVEQVIIARTTSTTLPPKQQAETAISGLQTPVYTITPTLVQTQAAPSPTVAAPISTSTKRAFTPTGTTGSTSTIPPTSPVVVFTGTPTSTLTLTVITTQPTATIPSNSTRTPTGSATRTPRPTSTLVPTPHGVTATPSPKPTKTPKPTLTASSTPPPATGVVTGQPPTATYTPSLTLTPTYTPSLTLTPTFTPSLTLTPTFTPTRTYTPTFTPTRTPYYYPPPPTIPPYP